MKESDIYYREKKKQTTKNYTTQKCILSFIFFYSNCKNFTSEINELIQKKKNSKLI